EIIDDGVLIKKGKNLISSQSAKDLILIQSLHEDITLPDMTAKLEIDIRKVKNSEMLMEEVINTNVMNMNEIRRIVASALQDLTV
ncbi:MAG: hypothetical protein IJ597_04560, partial [Synergistaceae bacterium]|nr:hypothetical protein [Synergistaceae bacterium]